MRASRGAAAMVIGLAVLVAVIDQLVKGLVVRALPLGESHPVIPGVLSLTYHRNDNIAFGLLPGAPMGWIIFLNLAMVAVFALLVRRHLAHRAGRVAAVLVLGGACGNLIDRIGRHYVVDYLDFHVWPVFNIADSAIVIGVALLLMLLFRADRAQSPA